MKKLFVFTAILGALIASSCNKSGTTSATITVSPVYDFNCTVPAQVHIPNIDTTIMVSANIDITDSRLEQCQVANLQSFFIEITTPNQTFNWCKEAHLFLSAEGLSESEVVSVANVSAAATRIDFTVSNINLAELLKRKMIVVKAKLVLREAFLNDIQFHGNIHFKATVKAS